MKSISLPRSLSGAVSVDSCHEPSSCLCVCTRVCGLLGCVCVLVHGCLCVSGSVCACSEATARFVQECLGVCVPLCSLRREPGPVLDTGQEAVPPKSLERGQDALRMRRGDVAAAVNSVQLEPGGGKSSLGRAQVLWGAMTSKATWGHVATAGQELLGFSTGCRSRHRLLKRRRARSNDPEMCLGRELTSPGWSGRGR